MTLALLVGACGDDEDGPLALVDKARPSDVADLAAIAASPTSITLAWTAPGDDGTAGRATAYDLRYSTVEIAAASWDSITQYAGEPAPRASGEPETLRVDSLASDTTYFFALRATDDAGNWSARSNVVSSRTVATPNVLPPARVTDLLATPATTSSVTLTWTAPGDDDTIGRAAVYDLRYSTIPITEGLWYDATLFIGETRPRPAASPETLEVRFLAEGATYYFALRTQDTGGLWSTISNVASATVKPDTIPPGRVEDLIATIQSPTRVALSWTAPGDDSLRGNAARYDIRYATRPITDIEWESASSVDYPSAPRLSATAETLAVRGLENDSTYYFALRTADNSSNWSALSNVASAGPLVDDVPPSAITDLLSRSLGGTAVRIEWTATGDDGCEGRAAAYDIRYSSESINDNTWPQASIVVQALVPDACGEEQSLAFDVPTDSLSYFIAMRALDERGQASSISNVSFLGLALLEGDKHWHVELGQLRPLGSTHPWIEGFAGSVVLSGMSRALDGMEFMDVFRWDGAVWAPMGEGVPSPGPGAALPRPWLKAATSYAGSIVVGGVDYDWGPHGTYARDPIFRIWDGASWSRIGAPSSLYSGISSVFGVGVTLYLSGDYNVGEFPDTRAVYYVERRIGDASLRLGNPNGEVAAIAVHGGAVIVGGGFTEVDSVPASHIAMWDGTTWSAMGTGLDGNVRALVSDGERLIAGGNFRTAGGAAANHIAEWDGASWQPLGDGLGDAASAYVSCLAFHNGELFAGGSFSDWEARGIRNVARWDGAQWRGLGSGTNRTVNDILSYEGVLYFAGDFDSAGGKPTNGVAAWEE